MTGSEAAGADVLRYQLLRAIAFGQDGDFDLGAMVERYNADLGKNLGNLLARTLGLCAKMTGGKVPPKGDWTPPRPSFSARSRRTGAKRARRWDRPEPHRALERTWAIASAANQYVDRAAPWAEEKKGNLARVETILSLLLVDARGAVGGLWPAMPTKSDEMRSAARPPARSAAAEGLARPQRLTARPAGMRSPPARRSSRRSTRPARALLDGAQSQGRRADRGSRPAPPRPRPDGSLRPDADELPSPTTTSPRSISASALVKRCERVPKKDKLLKLAVDVGEPDPRTIIAGLALTFQPDQLVGQRVVVVANLAPRDFGKGLVSQGMLLATGPSETLILATVDDDAAPGARLK